MKIQLCGAISGLEVDVYTNNFKNAQKEVEIMGYECLNPLIFTKGIDPNNYGALMGKCIEVMLNEADGVYLLKNCDKSKGAKIEMFTALVNKKIIIYQK
jgi:hypothetical protein